MGYNSAAFFFRGGGYIIACPTNNALLINFLLSSDAEIFVNRHQLSTQIGTKRAKKVCVCNLYVFQLSFHFCTPPLVVGCVIQTAVWDARGRTERDSFFFFNAVAKKTFIEH